MKAEQLIGRKPSEVIHLSELSLARNGVNISSTDLRAVLANVREYGNNELITSEEAERFANLVMRLAQREPLAYVLGRTTFMGHQFIVDQRSHIPRAAMEGLVQRAIDVARARIGPSRNKKMIAVDVGTGCGALAIMLALSDPGISYIYGIDISLEALEVARQNRTFYDLESRIVLLHGDLVVPLPERVDLFVANLPFVSYDQMHDLAPGVQEYEPNISVFGEDDGWGQQRRMLAMIPNYALPGAVILVTLHVLQETEARKEIARLFPAGHVEFSCLVPNWSMVAAIELR